MAAVCPWTDFDPTGAALGLRLPPSDLAEFRDRVAALLDEFAARPDDPSADAWSVFYALHPDPNRPR